MKMLTILMMVSLVGCAKKKLEDVVVHITSSEIDPMILDDVRATDHEVTDEYFIRKGEDIWGNCYVQRFPIVKSGESVYLRMGAKGETCAGVNCSHCAFKDGGGCECKNSLNTCNHTITRVRDILRLQ